MEDHAQVTDGCRLPPELDDLALIAAIDGEADAEVMEHLRACVHCAARARHFADLQGLLRQQFFRMFCPSSDTLVAFHQGILPGSRQAQVASHASECPYCSRELQLLKHLSAEDQVGRSPPAPHDSTSASSNLTLVRGLRHVVAQLMPSRPLALAGAYRGRAHSLMYAYQAENLQITLDVHQVPQRADRRVVVGTLDIDDGPAPYIETATASLLRSDTPISTAHLDELGNFVLDNLPPGTYSLALRLPDREVVIETLNL